MCYFLIQGLVTPCRTRKAAKNTGNFHALALQMEFAANVHHRQEVLLPTLKAPDDSAAKGSPWEPFGQTWEWTDLDQELLEEYERHERYLNADPGP